MKKHLFVVMACEIASDAVVAWGVFDDAQRAESCAVEREAGSDTESYWVEEVPFYE